MKKKPTGIWGRQIPSCCSVKNILPLLPNLSSLPPTPHKFSTFTPPPPPPLTALHSAHLPFLPQPPFGSIYTQTGTTFSLMSVCVWGGGGGYGLCGTGIRIRVGLLTFWPLSTPWLIVVTLQFWHPWLGLHLLLDTRLCFDKICIQNHLSTYQGAYIF